MNHYIDHTLLAANATTEQIERLCQEAKLHEFCSVCVNPTFVSECARLLADSDVKVCTVIGFPLGANTADVKLFETQNAILNGADEIDMVVNIGHVIDGLWDQVAREITAIKQICGHRCLKVIFETCLLSDEQIVKLCEICKNSGADYVKTSTGFSSGGATVEHIKLMRDTVGSEMGVKASGGVRSVSVAKAMIEAGATRIGTSSGVSIVSGTKADAGSY